MHYLEQHMHELNPCAAPYMPRKEELRSESDEIKGDKESKPYDCARNNKAKEQVDRKIDPSFREILAWIKEGRVFKKLHTPNSNK